MNMNELESLSKSVVCNVSGPLHYWSFALWSTYANPNFLISLCNTYVVTIHKIILKVVAWKDPITNPSVIIFKVSLEDLVHVSR